LSVPEDLRRSRIATRLVSALTHIALTTGGFDSYVGGIDSPYTIRIIEKMFPDRVTYRPGIDPADPTQVSTAEAFEYVAHGRVVVGDIDLVGLNSADFEQPENWQAPWNSAPPG
jgi:hypothetical protein